MPAELSVLFRYKCDHDKCTSYFKWRADVEAHKLKEHNSDSDLDQKSDQSTVTPPTPPTPIMPPRQEQNVKCTFADCDKMFDTKGEMIAHKIDEPAHDFCPKCPVKDEHGNDVYDENGQKLYGVDCEDWSAFVQHKVTSKKHISCPTCGKDYKSKGGLKAHVEQVHPEKQQIGCPFGCGVHFGSGSELLRHLEHQKCRNKADPASSFKKEDLYNSIQRKAVVNDILKHHDPSSMFSGSSVGTHGSDITAQTVDTRPSRETSPSTSSWAGDVASRTSSDGTQTTGGVLLDQGIETHLPLKAPLQPTTAPLSQPQTTIVRNGRVRTVTRYAPSSYQSSDAASVTSELSTSTVKGPSNKRDNSVQPAGNMLNGYAAESSEPASRAWNSGTTSTRLFPNARYNPTAQPVSAANFAEMKRQIDAEHARSARTSNEPRPVASQSNTFSPSINDFLSCDSSTNMFHQNFWNPDKPGFTAELFFNQLLGSYVCPFPRCTHTVDSPSGLSDHLRAKHRLTELRCPSCQKVFKTASDMMAHLESRSSRCKIRSSEKFNELVDMVSGGILNVKRERTYRDRELNRGGEDDVEEEKAWDADMRERMAQGLRGTSLRFEAQRPLGFGA